MKLIINADDFGLSKSITDGIIDGMKEGFITSTTVMVNMKYSEYAIKKAIENDIYSVGLHINLTAGKPIIKNNNLTDESGRFLNRNLQLINIKMTYEDVYDEIVAQINKFNEYSEGKLQIDHLDAHHFLINNDTVKNVVEDISIKLNIPVRNENGIKTKCPDIIYTDFSLDDVSIESINKMISLYKDKDIIVELLTHPGYVDEYTKSITSKLDREEELIILKQATEDGLFSNIKLINFSQI